jgi:methyltransferase (TIGR00027 family)
VARDAPTGVGSTAVGVAAMRAWESTRPDRLFEDPLAAEFVAAAGWERPRMDDVAPEGRAALRRMASWVSARTRFLDDLLLDATAGGVRQVVLLGAGLDARAFRLDWPDGMRLFELDTAEMLGFKQRVLAEAGARARCERVVVPTDLRGDWPAALRAAGFDPAAPVAWVIEGLLVYLDEDSVDRLMQGVAALSAPGSRLGLTASSSASIDSWRSTVGEGVSELWVSALPEAPEPWLAGYGWIPSTYDSRDRLAAYGRTVPERERGGAPTWLIDARR